MHKKERYICTQEYIFCQVAIYKLFPAVQDVGNAAKVRANRKGDLVYYIKIC